ncbi:MAG: SDR family NAD(P)-dependent oxidoreductase [Acidobacteriota bacterium]
MTAPDADRRVALVTGGSRGIGRALVTGLLDDGYVVYFCGRDANRARAVADDLTAAHPERVVADALDLADADEAYRYGRSVVERAGRVDVLINNAGVGLFGAVDAIDPEDWHRLWSINVHAPFHLLRAIAPGMRSRRSGWVVNIASLAGRHAFANGGAYCASKAALLAWSESAMLDLRADGVRVVSVLPGSVATHFSAPDRAGASVSDADAWKLRSEDVSDAVRDLLRHAPRALPSVLELRPTLTAAMYKAQQERGES